MSQTPLYFPTLVQTAWVVDCLIAVHDHPIPEIEKGIVFLLNRPNHPEKILTYPTGAGLPGHFYIHYHSHTDIGRC